MGEVIGSAMDASTDSTTVETRRIIGLTGGIATGKSTVSDYLANQYQLPVLDADEYAHEAVAKGSGILQRVCDRYGPEILLPDATLNRAKLGQIIFTNPAEKKWLEQQIHPFVRARFSQETVTFHPQQTLVYSIPLLFEAKLTHLVTEVWVVTCQSEQQKARLMARNQLSEIEAIARINSQMNLKEKCQLADSVLDNTSTKAALFSQIDTLIS